MEELLGAHLSERLAELEDALLGPAEALSEPEAFLQLAIVLASLLVGFVAGRVLEARLEARVRRIHGRPRLLRLVALLLRRTPWIVSAALLGLAWVTLRQIALPSRSVIVAIALALLVSWLVISVVSRLIRNRTFARFVAWVAWIAVALRIAGLFDEVAEGLDAAALSLGRLRISLWLVLQAVVLVGLFLWAAITLGNAAERWLSKNADLTPSLRVLIGKLMKIALLLTAAGAALALLGIDFTAFTFLAGALGLGVGFGLQKVVSNFVSGVIILLDKSIKPGDTIAIGDTFGWVRSLRARFVSVITRDGREYLIPNEDFVTQRVENWSFTDTLVRIDVTFGVDADANPHDVRRIAVGAVSALKRVQERPAPVCHLTGFGESSLDFILRFWIADPQNGVTNVKGAVLLACWDAFTAAGIGFPYPHRQLVADRPFPVRVENC
jgi:small-conductance mechanosensitive channel